MIVRRAASAEFREHDHVLDVPSLAPSEITRPMPTTRPPGSRAQEKTETGRVSSAEIAARQAGSSLPPAAGAIEVHDGLARGAGDVFIDECRASNTGSILDCPLFVPLTAIRQAMPKRFASMAAGGPSLGPRASLSQGSAGGEVQSSPWRAIAALPAARDSPAGTGACANPDGDQGYAFVDVDGPCIVMSEWTFAAARIAISISIFCTNSRICPAHDGVGSVGREFALRGSTHRDRRLRVAHRGRTPAGHDRRGRRRPSGHSWMTAADTVRLLAHIDGFLPPGCLPISRPRKSGARRSRRPW